MFICIFVRNCFHNNDGSFDTDSSSKWLYFDVSWYSFNFRTGRALLLHLLFRIVHFWCCYRVTFKYIYDPLHDDDDITLYLYLLQVHPSIYHAHVPVLQYTSIRLCLSSLNREALTRRLLVFLLIDPWNLLATTTRLLMMTIMMMFLILDLIQAPSWVLYFISLCWCWCWWWRLLLLRRLILVLIVLQYTSIYHHHHKYW